VPDKPKPIEIATIQIDRLHLGSSPIDQPCRYESLGGCKIDDRAGPEFVDKVVALERISDQRQHLFNTPDVRDIQIIPVTKLVDIVVVAPLLVLQNPLKGFTT